MNVEDYNKYVLSVLEVKLADYKKCKDMWDEGIRDFNKYLDTIKDISYLSASYLRTENLVDLNLEDLAAELRAFNKEIRNVKKLYIIKEGTVGEQTTGAYIEDSDEAYVDEIGYSFQYWEPTDERRVTDHIKRATLTYGLKYIIDKIREHNSANGISIYYISNSIILDSGWLSNKISWDELIQFTRGLR